MSDLRAIREDAVLRLAFEADDDEPRVGWEWSSTPYPVPGRRWGMDDSEAESDADLGASEPRHHQNRRAS